jgi:hypothetical protein
MKRLLSILILSVILTMGLFSQIKQIDSRTWYWQKGNTLTIMKVVITKTDTTANYHYYEHSKTTLVKKFNLKRFLETIK